MVRFILTDIEGTTTDIDFVHKVLFPYAAQHLEAFIAEHHDQAPIQACLQQVKDTIHSEESRTLTDAEAVAQLLAWIHADRKHTALKQLQGMIWKQGYESGDYQGHVYPDVLPQLQQWKAQGIGLGIYSSGSVQAQQLLFRHSIAGDLTPYFTHYFDTHIGGKKEPDSYAKIAHQLQLPPLDILFLSDIPEELDAAAQAGLQVIQLVRNPDQTRLSTYTQASTFTDIHLEEASVVC